jgi:hypothetical protein
VNGIVAKFRDTGVNQSKRNEQTQKEGFPTMAKILTASLNQNMTLKTVLLAVLTGCIVSTAFLAYAQSPPRDAHGWSHLLPNQFLVFTYEEATTAATYLLAYDTFVGSDRTQTASNAVRNLKNAYITQALSLHHLAITQGQEAFALSPAVSPDSRIIAIFLKSRTQTRTGEILSDNPRRVFYLILTTPHYFTTE